MTNDSSGSDLARLRSVLSQLPTGALPPRILNTGCGAYPCARTLHGARPGWGRWGVDWDESALRRARRADPALRLVCADAKHLPVLLHGRFGLVLVRHPDLFQTPAWRAILPRLPALVAPGGSLLITLYAPEEVEMVRSLPLPPQTPLAESALAPVDLAGRDRFVLAYYRPF